MNKIKLNEKDYRELYEGWMSKALKAENKVMGEYSDREESFYINMLILPIKYSLL